jgi:hypothetical protein
MVEYAPGHQTGRSTDETPYRGLPLQWDRKEIAD